MTSYKEGTYLGTIQDQGIGKSSNGNPQPWIEIQPLFWESQDGKDRDPVTSTYTRTIKLPITRKNVHIVAKELAQLGYRGDPSAIGSKEGEARLIGVEAKFIMELKEYKGKAYEKWRIWTAPKQTERKSMDSLSQTEGLQADAQFAAAFREAQSGQAPAPATETVESTAAGDDVF